MSRVSVQVKLAGCAFALVALGGAFAALPSVGGGTTAPVHSATAHRCLVVTASGDLPFSRNFNPFSDSLDLTSSAIYEPLVVVTSGGGGHRYNWLASAFSWSPDRKTLTLTVRPGVRWTDGEPLTSRDVAYTLTAGRQAKVMDQIGLTRRGNEVVSVRTVGANKVAIRLRRVDSTFIESVLASDVRVVPEHVFAHVRKVGGWRNPHPVGTGPFAVVERFGDQSYTLGRNPTYWQPGRPRLRCIERVVASSNESAVLQSVNGDIDLTNNFIPNAQRAYVAHDPAHFHYFYPADRPGIGLFLDNTVYPFSIVALRQAISRAIDREKLMLAEHLYAKPVDGLGINRAWPGWIEPDVAAESAKLATYDPAAARRLLLAAGFTYDGASLRDPRGNPVVIDATVIAGWTDWYADWGEIAKDLARVGIKVNIEAVAEFGAWSPDAWTTKKATLLWNTAGDTPTPYGYFKEHLDPSSFIPSGKTAESTGNWEHFQDARAAPLLDQFRSTADLAVQHRIADRLERLFLQDLPFVPLFSSPVWSTYSTRYFVGFPTARDDYVEPDFTATDYVVAWTRIRPRS